jgi:hypothetical protein
MAKIIGLGIREGSRREGNRETGDQETPIAVDEKKAKS